MMAGKPLKKLVAGLLRSETAPVSLVEMSIEGVGTDPDNNYVVVLRVIGRDLLLPIWLNAYEASAIYSTRDSQASDYYQTHDLMLKSFTSCGIVLARVTIDSFEAEAFQATLHLHSGGAKHEVAARPGDAITLALRAGVPIFASAAVIEGKGVAPAQLDLPPIPHP